MAKIFLFDCSCKCKKSWEYTMKPYAEHPLFRIIILKRALLKG